MITFRDRFCREQGLELIVHINEEGVAEGINPFDHGSKKYTDIMKTQALKQALNAGGYDAAFGGARRDEEKSRAKERVYSFRDRTTSGTRRTSGPSSGTSTTARSTRARASGSSPSRTGPSSTSGSTSGIERRSPSCPLYFAAPRPVVERDGDADHGRRRAHAASSPARRRRSRSVRFRTLGCYPLSRGHRVTATTLPEIIEEMLLATHSERQGRVIDYDEAGSMEKKKREGYF